MKKFVKTLLLAAVSCAVLCVFASANNTKLIALTFDDGPCPNNTPLLLDALAERDVHVSFFQVGNQTSLNKEIAKRAYDEGHQLCNHSYSHPWFTRIGASKIREEVTMTSDLLSEITGESDFLFRIPYGSISSTIKSYIPSPIIQWSVDPGSGNMNTNEYIMKQNFVDSARDGSIVILHDTNRKNVSVALYAIDALLEQGYEFVTLNELFRLRGITPQIGEVYYCVPSSSSETYFDEARLNEHWAFDYIKYVSEQGIMQGDGACFEPNGYMSRAMAATIIWRMSACPQAVPHEDSGLDDNLEETTSLSKKPTTPDKANTPMSGFTDVPDGLWFSEAVTWAHQNGCVEGVGNSLFAPNDYITKEQFYTMLKRIGSDTLAAATAVFDPASYRDDVRISEWAKESVFSIRQTGFASKNDPEIFRPLDFITRAEAAELVTWFLRDCPQI